jgi:hypothetical protein
VTTFWESETYAIIKAMKRSGNRPGVIAEWKDAVERWADLPENLGNKDAAAVRAWLPAWQPRPFYTAAELAPMWPALAIAVGATMRLVHPKSAMRLANELDFGGLPRVELTLDYPVDGNELDVRNLPHFRDYFIVERIHHWNRPLSVKEFLDALD